MSRITVDMDEVRAAAASGHRTASTIAAVAAAVGALDVPDTGSSTGNHLAGQVLRQAAAGVRVMGQAVDDDATLLLAIARRYAAVEAAAAQCE